MKRNIFWFIGALVVLCCTFASCNDDDTPMADPYSEWALRNAAYIDSIAGVAKNPPAGESWGMYLNYKLQNQNVGGIGSGIAWANSDYVYAKILPYKEGEVTELGAYPQSDKDTVVVHYRGRLIDGTVFDQSYSGDWDERVSVPAEFTVGGVITGWSTMLWHMREGEHVELYIPQGMAYGSSSSSNIPSYSTLIFDMRLEEIKHAKGPDDRSRKLELNE